MFIIFFPLSEFIIRHGGPLVLPPCQSAVANPAKKKRIKNGFF